MHILCCLILSWRSDLVVHNILLASEFQNPGRGSYQVSMIRFSGLVVSWLCQFLVMSNIMEDKSHSNHRAHRAISRFGDSRIIFKVVDFCLMLYPLSFSLYM